MICSFFGHRSIEFSDHLYAATESEIRAAIKLGCRIFYFGGFGDFDELCRRIVTKIMAESPALGIRRVFCVPQERDLRRGTRLFRREDYEEAVYLAPSFEGWYRSIYFRNCAMIDQSDVVILYAEARAGSGAYKAYEYARRKKEKRLVNLYNRERNASGV